MRKLKIAMVAAILAIFGSVTANAQSLGNLLGGSLGQTVGNLLEGVFSSSDITLADLEGTWTSDDPAVCFRGEGFLKQAGGIAAASALETKLSSYYDKLGLTGAELSVDSAANFTLKCKSITLRGTITRQENATPGVFEFDFNVLGKKVAGVTTYIQKTSKSMDVMFDITKLKKLLSTVTSTLNISSLQTISKLLDQYDGLCAGFHFSGTNLPESSSGIFSNSSNNNASTGTSKTGEAVKSGLQLLKEKLK